MAEFKVAHKLTSISEGGYTSDEDDNGNWTGGKKGVGVLIGTNYGISAPVYAAYLKKIPTALEMKNMPQEHVEDIYKNKYWNPIRGDEIINQTKANQIYDMAVNSGVGTAIILTYRAEKMKEWNKMTDKLLNRLNQV